LARELVFIVSKLLVSTVLQGVICCENSARWRRQWAGWI